MAFKHGIEVADALLAFIFIQPLGTFFWRGTWEVWGWYVKIDCLDDPPGNNGSSWSSYKVNQMNGAPCVEVTGSWVIGIISCLFMTIVNCFAPLIQEHCVPAKVTMPGYIIITRLYFLIFGFAYFGHWRGVWVLCDYYSGDLTWRTNTVGLAATYGLAMVLRTSKMAMSSPWHCGFDLDKDIFMPRGWFRTTVRYLQEEDTILLCMSRLGTDI